MNSRVRFDKNDSYERLNRLARWLILLIIAATFPVSHPLAPEVFAALGAASVFNLSRYVPVFMKAPAWASPIGGLAVDVLLVASVISAVGSISTPYTGLFIGVMVVAMYRTGLRGLGAVIAVQLTVLATSVAFGKGATATPLSDIQTVMVSFGNICLIGFLIAGFTSRERSREKDLSEFSEAMLSEQERMQALINTLPDAIFVIDAKNRLRLANGAALELMGEPTSWVGVELTKLLPLQPRSKLGSGPVNLLEAGTAQHRRDLRLIREKVSMDLDLSVTPVQLGQSGNNFIVVGRDITKERSIDRQREEFIAVTSHELRTPLAIVEVALSTSLLSKADMPGRTAELVDQAYRNTLFLGALVKDLTTLSEAQNDNLPIALKPVDAGKLLRQLGTDFQKTAEAKGLPLQVAVAPETPAILSTEHYIHEVLQNYINNALKYTKTGHITLSAKPSQNGGVRFGVSDTGPGISASDQQHLFTKFYRAEDYQTRETGGTGLGLYLCLELAERLNARVWCESKVGVGSTFYLEVPPFSKLRQDHGKVVEAQVSNLVDQL